MRFPRWLVVTLLSVSLMAVLGAGGWWWVTWPTKTANRFVNLLLDNQRVEAARLMINHQDMMAQETQEGPTVVDDGEPPNWTPQKLTPESRSLLDIVACRQSFKINDTMSVSIVRGKLQTSSAGWNYYRRMIFFDDGEVDLLSPP